MKLSEAKAKFRIAKKLGLKRVRMFGIWERIYSFGNDRYGRVAVMDHEVLGFRDLPALIRREYYKLENEAYELNRKNFKPPLPNIIK